MTTVPEHGEQIAWQFGRISYFWAIAYFGQFLKITQPAKIVLAIFFYGKSFVFNCTNNGLGRNLGDLITNTSGHPVLEHCQWEFVGERFSAEKGLTDGLQEPILCTITALTFTNTKSTTIVVGVGFVTMQIYIFAEKQTQMFTILAS
jgi:hypothetical protein